MQFPALFLASLSALTLASPVPDTWYPISPTESALCASLPSNLCYTSMLAALVARDEAYAQYGNPTSQKGDFFRHCLWSAHNVLALPEDGGALAEKMCINHEDNDDGDSEDEKKMYLAACKVGRECALKATRPQSSYVEKCCKEITEAGRPKNSRN